MTPHANDRPSRIGRAAVFILFAPLLISWSLGTANVVLDLLSTPAAALASLPAAGGLIGVLLAATICLLPLRFAAFAPAAWPVAAVGLLTLLASASAATRPISWLPILILAGLAAGRAAAPSVWGVAARWGWPAGALGWAAAARARPFGSGLLPVGLEDAIAHGADRIPDEATAVVVVALCLAIAAILRRRAPPHRVGAAIGFGAASLAVGTFGMEGAWVSAAAIGLLLGAWPPSPRPTSWVLPLAIACSLGAIRLGVHERWNCSRGHDSRVTKFLLKEPVDDLAILPGNLPFLVTLGDGGAELRRFSTTGTINGTAPLDPPGGRLLATEGAIPSVVRLVAADGLLVEWWEAATLSRRASRSLPGCDVRSAAHEPGPDRVWVLCDDGEVRGIAPTGEVLVFQTGAGDSVLRDARGALLRFVPGPLPRVVVHGPDGAAKFDVRLGPASADAAVGPGRLVVARGPAGQIELRGPKPTIPGWPEWFPSPDSPEAGDAALRTVLQRVRAGVWPGRVDWVGAQRAVYVTSPIDATVRMVDAEVGWHQHAEQLGAPPRQVVVDPGSGTLYGVNRCGVFEVRIASTFPWSSSGDVESVPDTPTPAAP